MQITQSKEIFKSLSSGEVELSLPSLSSQREIWASLQFDAKANLCYNESITITLRGELHTASLREALGEFVKRHDAFRSCFSPDGRQIIVYRGVELNFSYLDISIQRNKVHQLKALEQSATQIEFDLIHGPLYFFQLACSRLIA